MSEAARSHRSDLRVEPFMDPPAASKGDASNRLAELAQLVGQDDPFRNMFRKGKSAARPDVEPVLPFPALPAQPAYHDELTEGHEAEGGYAVAEDEEAPGLRGPDHEVQDWDPAAVDTGQWGETDEQHPDYAAQGSEFEDQHQHETVAEMPVDDAYYAAPPLTPDLWAEEGSESEEPSSPALSNEAANDAKAPRRPLVVLLAVLALTGGGLAATFLSRSGSGAVMTSNGTAPTIMAASGPTKIKQTDGASDTTPEDADAALLNKNGASSGGPVKVVNSQEQPIDLAQLPKAAGSPGDAAATDPSSAFPAPKKVKTFLVRPDGSLVGGGSASAAPATPKPAVPQLAAGAVGDPSDMNAPPVAAPRPSTPKSGSHAATTPKAPPASIADLAAPDAADPVKAKQAASSKPVEMPDAAATDSSAASASGGNFSLQLAASPNEQDARSAFTKLKKKYSELDGYQPTVKKVDNGQKTVYRLRVGNLSQDQAKSLCSKLQASGGSCFVVHN